MTLRSPTHSWNPVSSMLLRSHIAGIRILSFCWRPWDHPRQQKSGNWKHRPNDLKRPRVTILRYAERFFFLQQSSPWGIKEATILKMQSLTLEGGKWLPVTWMAGGEQEMLSFLNLEHFVFSNPNLNSGPEFGAQMRCSWPGKRMFFIELIVDGDCLQCSHFCSHSGPKSGPDSKLEF